jgi:predicted NBD/HSP70 family sugar kinase
MGGKLYYGTQGIAGEIGHISIDYNGISCDCGNRGCLRNYCTEAAVIRRAHESIGSHPESRLNGLFQIHLTEIIDLAIDGDAFSIELIQEAGTFLGIGLINTIYAYNPDRIVLSRQFSKAGNIFLDAAKHVLQTRMLPAISKNVSVTFSTIDKDPVLIGAVALVTDLIFKNPSVFMKLSRRQDSTL